MTYEATLDYLYRQLPMFQRIGKAAFKKNLNNIIRLCDALGQPQTAYPTIHIAGTNGKGSVTHMIGAVLQESGYSVGYYTSPHLVDFRERIKINGTYVSKEFVVDFTARVKNLVEDISPSFFELTVAMAFAYFAEQNVDVAVIETGMGGRLDSTNVLRPVLSVITNVGYDHQQYLGDTLAEIAFEKAGIIKPGTQVVIGESHPETAPVFQDMAFSRQAPILFADQLLQATRVSTTLYAQNLLVTGLPSAWPTQWQVGSGAHYQQQNTLTALVAIQQLQEQGWSIPLEAIVKGLRQFKSIARFTGRWQMIQEKSPVILADCAHNPQGLKVVMDQIQQMAYAQLHMVLGTVIDKKLHPFLHLLPTEAKYYFCAPAVPRGLQATALAKAAETHRLYGEAYPSIDEALAAAKKEAQTNDIIYIGGSIFVVAEILAAQGNATGQP